MVLYVVAPITVTAAPVSISIVKHLPFIFNCVVKGTALGLRTEYVCFTSKGSSLLSSAYST